MIRQASCVAIGGRAVLLEGPSGIGKSSLALALIDRGAVLVGDDGVTLEAVSGVLHASPPPNISGLLEIRNVALASFPVAQAPVALHIALTPEAPRHIERPGALEIAGCAIPSLALYPDLAVAALRTEHALRLYGLPLPGTNRA